MRIAGEQRTETIAGEQRTAGKQRTCKHEDARTVARFSQSPLVVCPTCRKEWRCVPLDFYFADDDGFESSAIDKIIGDCLREGRDRDAITIYLDTHWSTVTAILKERDR